MKKKRKAAKRTARERTNAASRNSRTSKDPERLVSIDGIAGFTTSFAKMLQTRGSTLARRHTTRADTRQDVDDVEDGRSPISEGDNIEMTPMQASNSPAIPVTSPTRANQPRSPLSTASETSSTSATPSMHVPQSFGQALSLPATWLRTYFRRIRHAHDDAAKGHALERAERRQHVFATGTDAAATRSVSIDPNLPAARRAREQAHAEAAIIEGEGVGWGLGSFGIREHRESAARLQSARDQLQDERLLGSSADDEAGPPSRPAPGEQAELKAEEEAGDGEWEHLEQTTSSGSGSEQNGTRSPGRRKDAERKQEQMRGWSW